jgi:uncharacterized protein (TIGR03435 family)
VPRELVRAAIAEAERSVVDVRAAVRLRGARVLQRFDSAEARRLVNDAIDLVSSIDDAEVGEPMRFSAVPIVATVAPSVAIRLLTDEQWTFGFTGPPIDQTLLNMIEHGHRAEAIAYLVAPDPALPYPMSAAMSALHDEASRTAVLRAAVEARRREHASGAARRQGGIFGDHMFCHMFSGFWRSLPTNEARAAVRDIAERILAAPDHRMSGGLGSSPDQPRFSSSREQQLYGILAPLRHLEPEYTQALLAEHPQLAKAAARYPFGEESVMRELEARSPEPGERPAVDEPPEHAIYFDSCVLSPKQAVATDFAEPFVSADGAFERDSDPVSGNAAPIECWPSTSQYRAILFHAGVHEGRRGTRHLARIPSDDIRPLAAIELAAALAGLPRIGDLTRGPGGRRRRASRLREIDESAAPPGFQMPVPVEPLPPARRPNRPASMEVRISPTTKAPGDRLSGGCGSDFWVIEGAPLAPVIARLWNVPERDVEIPDPLARGRYDFSLVLLTDGTQEEMRALMRSGIQESFGVTIATEPRSMDVILMTAPKGVRVPAAPSRRGGGFSGGTVSWTHSIEGFDPASGQPPPPQVIFEALVREQAETTLTGDLDAVFDMSLAAPQVPQTLDDYMAQMTRRMARMSMGGRAVITGIKQEMSMAELSYVLGSALSKTVIDETGLQGQFSVDVEADTTTSEAFLDVLAARTGLVFTQARREQLMVVVRSRA